MITEEEKKQLLDDIEKAHHQHWLEMMADYQARMKFVIGLTDTFIDYNKEQMDKGQPISPFSEKKRLKMFIDSGETDYYGMYFPEDIEHLKSNYKKIEELEAKEKERIRMFRKAKLAKLPWWRRIFG